MTNLMIEHVHNNVSMEKSTNLSIPQSVLMHHDKTNQVRSHYCSHHLASPIDKHVDKLFSKRFVTQIGSTNLPQKNVCADLEGDQLMGITLRP
jgi:hypothetical protein